MRKRFLLLSILFILGIGFISYQVTHALFSDVAQSQDNTFTAAEVFPHLVINEVYYDVCTPASTCGNDPQNEWIELYNPTASPVDIKDWTITDNQETDTISTSSASLILPAGGFALISREQDTWDFWSEPASAIIINLGENIGNGLNNMGDRVILKDASGVTIDAMSYGTDITQLNPSATDVVEGHSLERDPDGVDTNTAGDFVDRTTPTPGS